MEKGERQLKLKHTFHFSVYTLFFGFKLIQHDIF
jgi:hypothetical protein